MKNEIALVMLVAGAALCVTCLFFLIMRKLIDLRQKAITFVNRIKVRKKQPLNDWYPVIGALIGIISALLLMWGQTFNASAFFIMMWVGVSIGYMAKILTNKENRYSQLRDASTFFKAVGVRLKAGYNVNYTLRMAAGLAPSMRPAVQKCLQRWSFDPRQALEGLRDDLNIPEAETLCFVLIRANEGGGESVAHVLEQGAHNIDYKLAEMEEKSFAVGKMRYLLWRVLPVMSIFGLFAGNFAYYASNVLKHSLNNLAK